MPRRALKILHVVYSLDPGGMENGIVNIARALDRSSFDIHVCCLERRGAFADRLPNPEQVSVIGKQPGFSLATCRALRREILRLRPDVIHSHNLGPLIYGSIATAGGITAPILQGEHAELTPLELTSGRLRQRRWLYRCCKAVHSVSHGLHEQLHRLGFPGSKLRVIVNGVATDRFTPGDRTLSRQKLDIPESAFVFGNVGRFGPFKRHRLLLDAFEIVADRLPHVLLLIVGGGGPEEADIRERQRTSRHSSRIRLAGFQSDPLPCYQALDILVVPSVNEGLSNAVLEAMATGAPVLAHAACGNSEVISHGIDGFLGNLSTPEMLAGEMIQAAEASRSLPGIGLRGREKMVLQFSLSKMAEGYKSLYLEASRLR